MGAVTLGLCREWRFGEPRTPSTHRGLMRIGWIGRCAGALIFLLAALRGLVAIGSISFSAFPMIGITRAFRNTSGCREAACLFRFFRFFLMLCHTAQTGDFNGQRIPF